MTSAAMPGRGRALGPWRSWALVVGSAIGSAIFLMPAVLAPYGGLGLVSWAVAGLGACVSPSCSRTCRVG